jgi:hypothetical protein
LIPEQYLTAIPDIAKSAKMVIVPSTSPIEVSAMLTTATSITDVVRIELTYPQALSLASPDDVIRVSKNIGPGHSVLETYWFDE